MFYQFFSLGTQNGIEYAILMPNLMLELAQMPLNLCPNYMTIGIFSYSAQSVLLLEREKNKRIYKLPRLNRPEFFLGCNNRRQFGFCLPRSLAFEIRFWGA